MTQQEREALKNLRECNDMVYNSNFTTKERKVLQELRKLKLVELAWVTTEAGKRSYPQ